jgi:hypothetical protein
MVLAADEAQSSGNLLAARSILAPQRYTYLPGTTTYSSGNKETGVNSPGIQFDPSDPLYSHVTNAMKAALAVGQLDATVGSYMANGLWRAQEFTNGHVYPSIFMIPALAGYTGGTRTVHINDSNSSDNSHYVTMTSQAWCGATDVTVTETVDKDGAYAPISFPNITDWRSAPSSYTGYTGEVLEVGSPWQQTDANANQSFTPFMGVNGSNPYLLVSINGTPQNWAYENFSPINCWNNPSYKCTSSMEIDPVAYATPDPAYDENNDLLGPQSNPFSLLSTSVYASAAHKGQWATNAAGNWGTFSKAVTVLGETVYEWVQQ